MRLGLPQLGRPVCEVQPAEETERASRRQRLCQRHQTPEQGVVSRRLSAEELAVRRLVGGTASSSRALTPLRPVFDLTLTSSLSALRRVDAGAAAESPTA